MVVKILFLLGLLLLALASQRLYAWPLPHTWEVSIGVTEWGHWLALLATLLLAVSVYKRQPVPALLAVVTLITSALPALQAAHHEKEFSFFKLFRGHGGNPPPTRTVVYSQKLDLDLYQPAVPNGTTLLVVHGGSWCRGNRREFSALNGHLQAQGSLVAALDYRLAPQNQYPAAVEDVELALDYLVQELHVDPKRIVLLGRSAGAHLALLAAYRARRHRVQAVIGFYPPTDMTWSYEHPSDPRVLDSAAAIADFMGGKPEQRQALYNDASPLLQVRAESPPTLLLHGDIDNLVYPEQTRRLERRLQDLGVAHQVVRIPWGNHGFDVNLSGPGGQLSTLAVERFLASLR